jgi:predicted acylesterase/phospholipase RssA/CRP-like cAMP-binding protein
MEASGVRPDPLRHVPLFAGIDPGLRVELAERGETVELPAGEWLFRGGDTADSMYVVLVGRIEVVIENPDPAVIRVLGAGMAVGELALVTDAPRSASVRARRDSRLLRLGRDDFLDLLRKEESFSLALIRALGAQLRESRALTPQAAPLPATIAVLPLAGGDAAPAVAAALEERLGAGTALLTEPDSDWDAHLDRAERESERVLLVAERAPGSGGWADFCMRQADRALLLADGLPAGGTEPAQGRARAELLLTGRTGPGVLGRWLEATGVTRGRALGTDVAGSPALRALARSLTGRSTGLVFSGGGARGLAHIGVIDALLEAGIEIDRVAGCSMGALIGGQFAMGLDPEKIRAHCEAELIRANPMGDYTLPLVALVRGLRAKAMVERIFGERQIEELPREFQCVSCDLVTAELVEHRRGPLFRAVGASFCLPAIGPPVVEDDRLLVDGGVLNNLPVEMLARSGEGPVIASDVTAQFQLTRRSRTAAGRARRLLRDSVLGLGTDVPLRLPEIVTRTITLGSIDTVEESQRHADLVVRPAVGDVGLVQFERIDQLRRAGREAALAAFEANPELVDALRGS